MARVVGKRRTREHQIADLSIHPIEGPVLRCGWVVERIAHDDGIDLEVNTFDRSGPVQEGPMLHQLKATKRLPLRPGATSISFGVERADLARWLAEIIPVILIVHDASKDLAYWLYVQSYFRRLPEFNLFAPGRTVTLYLPVTNVVARAAVRRFAHFRDRVVAQIRKVVHDEGAAGPLR
jgi:hypothetical protein